MGCEHTNVAAVCYFYSLRSHRWCSNKLWPIDGDKVSYYFQSVCPYVDVICFCTVAKFCCLPPSGFPVLEHITGNISCQNPVLILLEGRFVFFVHDRICGKVWLFGSGVPSAGSIPNQTLGRVFCIFLLVRGPVSRPSWTFCVFSPGTLWSSSPAEVEPPGSVCSFNWDKNLPPLYPLTPGGPFPEGGGSRGAAVGDWTPLQAGDSPARPRITAVTSTLPPGFIVHWRSKPTAATEAGAGPAGLCVFLLDLCTRDLVTDCWMRVFPAGVSWSSPMAQRVRKIIVSQGSATYFQFSLSRLKIHWV